MGIFGGSKSNPIFSKVLSPDKKPTPEIIYRDSPVKGDEKVENIKRVVKMISGVKVNKDFIKKYHYNPRRAKEAYYSPPTSLTSVGGITNLADATDPRRYGRSRLKSQIQEQVASDPLAEVRAEFRSYGYSDSEINGAIKDLIRERLLIKKGTNLEVR